MLCIHRLREGFKQERNACTNRIRGLLAEFGLVFAQKIVNLRQALPDVIEDGANELGGLARLAPPTGLHKTRGDSSIEQQVPQ